MFKNLWLKIQFLETMNHPYHKPLDNIFKEVLNKKHLLKNKKIDSHYIILTFHDNTAIKVWKANRFYAYASIGFYKSADLEVEWNNCRPSRKSMYQFCVTYDLPYKSEVKYDVKTYPLIDELKAALV